MVGRELREAWWVVAAGAGIVYLAFWSTEGVVEVATLGLAVVALIWFATVDRVRLIDPHGRPNPQLFGLAALAVLLVGGGALILPTATLFLSLGVLVIAVMLGLVRALRVKAQR